MAPEQIVAMRARSYALVDSETLQHQYRRDMSEALDDLEAAQARIKELARIPEQCEVDATNKWLNENAPQSVIDTLYLWRASFATAHEKKNERIAELELEVDEIAGDKAELIGEVRAHELLASDRDKRIASLEAQMKVPPDRSERTHWDGCYKDVGHHNCALVRIEQLEAERDALREIRDTNSDPNYPHVWTSKGTRSDTP